MNKKLFKHFFLLLLCMVTTGAKGADFVDKWLGLNESTEREYVTSVTLGENTSFSSNRIQVEKEKTGNFTVGLRPNGYTIKSIKFIMNQADDRISSFTSGQGNLELTATKEWTFTPSTSITSATFSLTTNSKGAQQISQMWVTFSDGNEDNDYESLIPSSINSGIVTCTSTAETSYVSISTTGNVGTSGNVPSISFGNGKGITITSTKNIKYILFSWYNRCPAQDSDWTSNVGSFSKADYKWTAPNDETKEVTFTRNVGNTANISNIHIVYVNEQTGPQDPIFTLAKSTIEVGEKTEILLNGDPDLNVFEYFDVLNLSSTVAGINPSWVTYFTNDKNNSVQGNFVAQGQLIYGVTVKDAYKDVYNSKTVYIELNVIPARVNPTFAVASSTIDQGGTTKIIVSGKDDLDGITLASATSSDETIATVDATTGVITGVGAGEATITFSTNQSDKYNSVENATVTVTVSNMIVPVITVKKTTLKVGEKITMLVNGNAWPLGEADHILIDPNNNYYNSEYLTIDVNGGITAKAATPANASTNVNFKTLANSKYVVGEFNEYFKVIEGVTQTTVSEAATWDWSKFGTNEIKLLDAGTSPLKSDEFILAEVYNYGLTSDAVPEAFGDAAALKVTCEYPVRDGKYLQGGYVKFNTTVPGTVEVVFSNTGNRNDDETHSLARFLNINGVNTSASSLKSSETTTGSADVPAGEVIIKGTLNSDNSDQYLRIYKITFTPKETPSEADLTLTDADAEETNKAKIQAMENKNDVTVTVDRAVTAGQWNTIYLPFAMNTDAINAAFGAGSVVAAYKEYVGGDLKFETVNETEANTAYLINPANTVESFTAENVNVVYAADKTMTDITLMAPGTAQFYGFLDNTEIAEPAVSIYYIATGNKIKRLATTGGTLKALHGYFLLGASDDEKFGDEFGANTLSFSIDGTTTGIVTVEGGEQKFVSGEMFNLAGQRVNDSYKGVVIVNGKKVIKK